MSETPHTHGLLITVCTMQSVNHKQELAQWFQTKICRQLPKEGSGDADILFLPCPLPCPGIIYMARRNELLCTGTGTGIILDENYCRYDP